MMDKAISFRMLILIVSWAFILFSMLFHFFARSANQAFYYSLTGTVLAFLSFFLPDKVGLKYWLETLSE